MTIHHIEESDRFDLLAGVARVEVEAMARAAKLGDVEGMQRAARMLVGSVDETVDHFADINKGAGI